MCRQSADIVVVLDQSTSIVQDSYDNWFTQVLGFTADIARSFEIGPTETQLAVLKFSDEIDIGFYLDDYHNKTTLVNVILQLDIRGGDTNIAAALKQTRNEMFSSSHGARSGVSKVLFLVTDGTPNIDGHLTEPEAKATRDAGIEIFAVGVTSNVNRKVLRQVASQPTNTHVYFVEMFDQLSNIVRTLVNVSCGTLPRSVATRTTAATTTTTTISATTTTTTSTTTTPVPTTTSPPGEFTSIHSHVRNKDRLGLSI